MIGDRGAIYGRRLTRPAGRILNEGMEVANPIYDVVFKYLMQDHRVARLLIGKITGLAVQSLTVSPQETSVHRTPDAPEEHDLPLTLLRMDFAARVQTADGSERQVLIEIQKAKAPTVVERFRRYLGQQISSRDNLLTHPSGRTEAVPIVTIYFLGYDLGLSDEAVIDICPRVTERRTGRELQASHPLVEGIHHRSHIIQIPRLARRRRDDLERVLAIFDQGLVKGNGRGDAHVLSIAEADYPAECGFVLRQLREAMAEEEVRRNMRGEDLAVAGFDSVGPTGGPSGAASGAGAAAGAASGAGSAAGGAGAPARRAGAAAGGTVARARHPPPAWAGSGCRGDRSGAVGRCGRGAAGALDVAIRSASSRASRRRSPVRRAEPRGVRP